MLLRRGRGAGDAARDCQRPVAPAATASRRRGRCDLAGPGAYERTLEQRGYVIADFGARRRAHSRAGAGARRGPRRAAAAHRDALLDEVTALVEWPVPLAGRLRAALPVAAARGADRRRSQDHQRYFPVEDPAGELLPAFITVSNIESREPDKVRAGNERVVRAAPRRRRLLLGAGPQAAARRAHRGARWRDLPGAARLARGQGAPRACARRGGRCGCRCPGTYGGRAGRRALPSATCSPPWSGEFPELQGIMGGYYAAGRRRAAGGRRGDPRALPAARRGRCAARDRRRHRGRARRQARHARRHLRDRREADRHQGPVRPAPRRARRAAHPASRSTSTSTCAR